MFTEKILNGCHLKHLGHSDLIFDVDKTYPQTTTTTRDELQMIQKEVLG